MYIPKTMLFFMLFFINSNSNSNSLSPPFDRNKNNNNSSTNWDSVETPGTNVPLTDNPSSDAHGHGQGETNTTSTDKESSRTTTASQIDTLSIINNIQSTTIKSSEITTTITTHTKSNNINSNAKTTRISNTHLHANYDHDQLHQALPNQVLSTPTINDDAQIGDHDIDVYEDVDEMIYCGYNDPISEMRLNRKNSKYSIAASQRRRSNSKTQMDSYADRYRKRSSNTIQSGTKSYLPSQTNIYLDTVNTAYSRGTRKRHRHGTVLVIVIEAGSIATRIGINRMRLVPQILNLPVQILIIYQLCISHITFHH